MRTVRRYGWMILAWTSLTQAGADTKLPAEWQPLAREVFAELVALETTSERGVTPAAEAMARRLRDAGFAAEDLFVGGAAPHEQNLVVRLRGKGKAKPVLFIVHLDVVPAKREDWSHAPFELTERDGWFYGRGTTDIKNEAADMVVNLIRLKREKYLPDRDIVVALTADEEVTSGENGVDWLLRERRDLVDAAFAINPDAGGASRRRGKRVLLELQTSEKVFQSFHLTVRDAGGHSSVPKDPNAIYVLAAGLERLAKHAFPVNLNETTRGFFATMAREEQGALAADMLALGKTPTDLAAAARVGAAVPSYDATLRTTCVATMLEGGHAENALPQLARATVNCRILPQESPDDVEATLKRVLDDERIAVTRVDPPKPSPPSPLVNTVVAPVTRVMRQMFPGVELLPTMSNGATDGLYLRNAGIPTYGVSAMFGDIEDSRAHGQDERIRVADYHDGVEFMYRFMKALTGGK
jgi:acetylornithine deacetylase/succinyl-diaminopimelate desuccinylase-like protein